MARATRSSKSGLEDSAAKETEPVATPQATRKRKCGTESGANGITAVQVETAIVAESPAKKPRTTKAAPGSRVPKSSRLANGVEASRTPTKKAKVKAASPLKDEPSLDTSTSARKAKSSKVKVGDTPTSESPPDTKAEKTKPKSAKTADGPPTDSVIEQNANKTKSKQVKTEEAPPADPSPEQKPKAKRKTKEEKEAEAMPLAARTLNHTLTIGAHVSSAGGVQNAVTNAVHIGANAFALFLKSQRKWANPPLIDSHCTSFLENCKTHSFDAASTIVPHGSYLVNLAHTDPERTKQAYDSFLDDLQRCERLGIKLYNFHPGNVENEPRDIPHATRRGRAIKHLASNLNRAHAETKSVVTLLENMAAKGGNTLGSTPEDLAAIIELVEDKSRVGICLDTCHAFASGLDMRDAAAVDSTFKKIDEVVGLQYLRALHLNDSKAPFESCRDLHANIGTGFIGLRGFHALMNHERVRGLPMVLETPIEVKDEDGELIKDEKGKVKEDKRIWAREIKLLETLVGMDVESDEFRELEMELARKGRKERERLQDVVDRREVKKVEKANKEALRGTKGKAKKQDESDDDSELSEE